MNYHPSSQNKYYPLVFTKFLTACLEQEGDALTILCYDFSDAIYRRFHSGMTFQKRAELLTIYCTRNKLFDELLQLVENLHPEKYTESEYLLKQFGFTLPERKLALRDFRRWLEGR